MPKRYAEIGQKGHLVFYICSNLFFMTIPDCIKIKKCHTRKGLFAKRTIKKGEIVFHFDGKMKDGAHSTANALQIKENKFLESTAKFDDFLNHSCNPNYRKADVKKYF